MKNGTTMTATCCNQCVERIAKTDTKCVRLWLELCAMFVRCEGIFLLRESRIPHFVPLFRTLESMGFITTADGGDAVKMRVEGYDIVEIDDKRVGYLETFCIDREGHNNEWV